MKTKKILIILALIVLVLMLGTSNVKAVLQSNGGTAATKSLNTWLSEIRQMQSAGGTLGLTDSINTTNLSSSNTNLDIHMQKNTEYGAVALLSASSYGNPNKITDGGTTTGNSSGVVMKINKEWTAAGYSLPSNSTFGQALGRYKNEYTNNSSSVKRGDAMLNWHGSTNSKWFSIPSWAGSQPGLLRAYAGSIFSYDGAIYYNGSTSGDAMNSKSWPARACIVVGSGI